MERVLLELDSAATFHCHSATIAIDCAMLIGIICSCHHHGPQGSDLYPAEGKPGCPSEKSPKGPKKCDNVSSSGSLPQTLGQTLGQTRMGWRVHTLGQTLGHLPWQQEAPAIRPNRWRLP